MRSFKLKASEIWRDYHSEYFARTLFFYQEQVLIFGEKFSLNLRYDFSTVSKPNMGH